MVSDPDKQTDSADAPKPEALSAAAGFASAASERAEESVAEDEHRKSYWRQFADYCAELRDRMKSGSGKKAYAAGAPAEGAFPYETTWMRNNLGHQVCDCGNCIHMSATRNEPVTKKQIECMVMAAINRKDPPWATIYMYNHKDKPDLQMAMAVQNVINEMRAKGKIPASCPIMSCTDASQYPSTGKEFDRMLRDLFGRKAQPENTNSERPGFHAARQRSGFNAAT